MFSASNPALYDSLADHPGLIVMGLNTNGQIQWVSRGFEVLTEYRSSELIHQDWVTKLIPPDHQESARALCRGRLGKDRNYSYIQPLLTQSGQIRHIDWIHSDLKNEEGQITGILCVGKDMTDLLTAREALVASEKRNRAIVETAVNAILTMSENCIIESVNSATERMFGYTAEELVGQNIKLLMPSPYKERHDHYIQNYLHTGVRKIIGIGREAVGQKKNGQIFPIDLSVGEAQLPEGKRIFTGIIRDLTERKALEEKLLRISEDEQQRIGQDIHDDLCQKLAAISCLAKVAQQQLVKNQAAQADNLGEIVRLLTQANMQAREMSRGLMPVVLDSSGLMTALSDLAQSTERIFRICCRYQCEKPVNIEDNKLATQLYRIAQEAVANAIKHSKADRLEINLIHENSDLILTIRDNGTGIPDNISGKSTGMGLLTMRHRAQMMGGELSIKHDEYGGTLVRCRVPLP